MNEIIIEDKKYISTKQAAELTGYAKDYVGQLCREGRVPARLIGRSWYVLSSAIQDHRFGEEPKKELKEEAKKPSSQIQSTWEAPTYKSEEPSFPFINKLAQAPKQAEEMSPAHGEESEKSIGMMQEAWKSWFSRDAEPKVDESTEEAQPEQIAEEPEMPIEEEVEESKEILVPIHAIEREEATEARKPAYMAREVEDRPVYVEPVRVRTVQPKKGGSLVVQSLLLVVGAAAVLVGFIGTNLLNVDYSSVPVASFLSGTYVQNNK